jgi:hypothetical protein
MTMQVQRATELHIWQKVKENEMVTHLLLLNHNNAWQLRLYENREASVRDAQQWVEEAQYEN